jgi:hypothetical protein
VAQHARSAARRHDHHLGPRVAPPFILAFGSSALYFGTGVDFTVQQLSPAFAVASSLRWPAVREPLTATEVERVHAAMVDAVIAYLPPERARPERVREAFAPQFAPEMLPAHRPALRRALADNEDRLWLERFEPLIPGTRRQPIASRWTVLAADGTPVHPCATTRHPPRRHPRRPRRRCAPRRR